jgi:nicotinamidase-related amidase
MSWTSTEHSDELARAPAEDTTRRAFLTTGAALAAAIASSVAAAGTAAESAVADKHAGPSKPTRPASNMEPKNRGGTKMPDEIPLMQPGECVLLLVDLQAGLAFGVSSEDRQTLVNNAIALARTAVVFGVPVVVSNSASKVYSGPFMPAIAKVLPSVPPIERRSMNVWEDDAARAAVVATGRRRLLVAGMLTEACVSFTALSALAAGYDVFVIADACGGLTPSSHGFALRRMEAAGARITSWIQVLLELQRDWTRKETYDGARAIVEANGGGYGIGLAYARDMIKPNV